jgi:alpha-galactosidase
MRNIFIKLAIFIICTALGGSAFAAADAGNNIQTLNANWASQAFGDKIADAPQNRLFVVEDSDPVVSPVINKSVTNNLLRLADKTYTHGIGVNSTSKIRVELIQAAKRLQADIGVDRNADWQGASVRFRVVAAGKEVFASEILRTGSLQSIDVPLDGAMSIDLIVDDGGDGRSWDQANWCNPRIELQDGSTVRLDEIAEQGGPIDGIPFSFVYGGKSSRDFLSQWKRIAIEEQINTTMLRRTLIFTDPNTNLVVKAVANIYIDTPGVDWTIYFTNNGTKDTPFIEKVQAVDVTLAPPPPLGHGITLHRLRGSAVPPMPFQPFDQAITSGGQVEFGADGGKPARTNCPFFTLDCGTSGVITAIGWSGQWLGKVERIANGSVRLQAGMQFMHLKLHPGETIRSPRIMQVYWNGGDRDYAHNQFRRTMLAHIVSQRNGQPDFPTIAYMTTSFYEMNATSEASCFSHLEAMQGLGFETYWLDAYWIRGGFPDGVGNYGFPIDRVESPDRFPNGMKPLSSAVHKAELDFLLWFEPERVANGTAIAIEHPEWVIGGKSGGLYDLGLPAALEYMTRYLKTVIREYDMNCLRIDYNFDPLPFWQMRNSEQPDRVGMSEIRYVEGLYKMWDDIRAEYPQLVIDNCASGGMRIDLETCARSVVLWRTDDTIGPMFAKNFDFAAIQNQEMTTGLNRYLPFSISGQMGAAPYHFRSGYNGGIAFAEDIRPKDYPRELLKQGIAEGKRLRKYLLGNYYPLYVPTVSAREWCVYQYHRADTGDGVVFAFRRHESPYVVYTACLREIDEKADYIVTESYDYTSSQSRKIKGSELRQLRVNIDSCPGSVVIEYRKAGL